MTTEIVGWERVRQAQLRYSVATKATKLHLKQAKETWYCQFENALARIAWDCVFEHLLAHGA